MYPRKLRWLVSGLLSALIAGLLGMPPAAGAQRDKKLELEKVPKQVMAALKAKFPKAEIQKWAKEKEGDDVVYDFEFIEKGRACEADIKEDGTYINYEKAIEAKDLPAAVTEAIESKFPKAKLQKVMEETEVKPESEKLSAYEIVLLTADRRTVEIRVAPKGKILEQEVLKGNKEK